MVFAILSHNRSNKSNRWPCNSNSNIFNLPCNSIRLHVIGPISDQYDTLNHYFSKL